MRQRKNFLLECNVFLPNTDFSVELQLFSVTIARVILAMSYETALESVQLNCLPSNASREIIYEAIFKNE